MLVMVIQPMLVMVIQVIEKAAWAARR